MSIPGSTPSPPMPSPDAVRLERLSKSFTEGDRQRRILDSVTAAFPAGSFTALFGRSGSGKSTLLNMLSGIDAPDSGDVWHGEVCLSRMPERARTLHRRARIGIVFQFFNLLPTLTALENVALPLELAGAPSREAITRARAQLDRVGLGDRAGTSPDRLSGGEQQRVAIARALVHNPTLIVADEPTGNLDADTGRRILDLLASLAREDGRTLIMATHSPEVLPFANHILLLDGRALREMSRDDMRRELLAEVDG